MDPAFDQLAAAGQKHVASKLQQSGCQDGDRFSQNLQPVNGGGAKGNVKAELAVIGRDAVDKINQTDRVGLITPGPTQVSQSDAQVGIITDYFKKNRPAVTSRFSINENTAMKQDGDPQINCCFVDSKRTFFIGIPSRRDHLQAV